MGILHYLFLILLLNPWVERSCGIAHSPAEPSGGVLQWQHVAHRILTHSPVMVRCKWAMGGYNHIKLEFILNPHDLNQTFQSQQGSRRKKAARTGTVGAFNPSKDTFLEYGRFLTPSGFLLRDCSIIGLLWQYKAPTFTVTFIHGQLTHLFLYQTSPIP